MDNIVELLTFAINNGAEQVLISGGSPPVMRRQGKLVSNSIPYAVDTPTGVCHVACEP